MVELPRAHRQALRTLVSRLSGEPLTWALTGSTSFALQGVPVEEPADIDVQTTDSGAYAIEELFPDAVVEPVSRSASDRIRSHFGELRIEGVSVEVMGDVQKRRADGSWESPVDVESHREMIEWEGFEVPVLSLSYEAAAYERLGRTERAELLREVIGDR